MENDRSSTRNAIDKIVSDLEKKVSQAEDSSDAATTPLDEAEAAESKALADRLWWIIRVAGAHSQGDMPWRASPPTPQDEQWCEEVIQAVRGKRARPSHPDPDIEQMLLDALPT